MDFGIRGLEHVLDLYCLAAELSEAIERPLRYTRFQTRYACKITGRSRKLLELRNSRALIGGSNMYGHVLKQFKNLAIYLRLSKTSKHSESP